MAQTDCVHDRSETAETPLGRNPVTTSPAELWPLEGSSEIATNHIASRNSDGTEWVRRHT